MFWKFNLLTSSHVDTLLEKEDVTLRELMDEDDILQECRAQNRKLIDFLIKPENMEDMVRMITKEPSEEIEDRLRFKYPNTACELLTTDVSQIIDKLAGDKELVDQLYSFLESDKPLNPLLASFFSKVMGQLITRKSEMIFEYLKSQKDFVGSLLHHIGTSAIMDLLLRLITCIESPETRRAVIDWLNEQQIVQRLVDSIVPSKDADIHCNAAQSLCDIVRLGREQIIQLQDISNPDPLLTTMEMEETVSKLLSNMFDLEQNESVIVNGLFVIHTLLEGRRPGQDGLNEHMGVPDNDRLTQGSNNVLAALTPRLKDFHNLLLHPPKQRYNAMPTSVGTLDPPLGNARLQVAKLIMALVSSNRASVNQELVNLNTLQALLDLYFHYTWNNFLHTQVEQCINVILSNPAVEVDGIPENPLLSQLFTEVKLVQRLLDEWEENEQQENTENGRRKGFMGHLTKVANSISGALERGANSDVIKEYLSDLPENYKQKWEAFLGGTLVDINKRNTVEFRGHPLASSSEDDDVDPIPFPQDTAMQQAFSDYQLQQMTSNFIDQFGFNEEEFAEQEEKIDAPFSDRISSINFNIQANEVPHPNSTMFEQACNERINQFDDDDSDEDIWVEKPLTFDKTSQHARSERLQGETARANSSDDSTDSEEELDSPRTIHQQLPSIANNIPTSTSVGVPTVLSAAEKMDVDSSEPTWTPGADSVTHSEPTDMETNSPWETGGQSPAHSGEGWAAFDKNEANEDNWADFSSFSDIERNGPRSSSPVAMDTTESSRGNIYIIPGNSTSAGSSVHASTVRIEDLDQVEDDHPQPDSTSPSPSSKICSSRATTVLSAASTMPTGEAAVSSTSSEADGEKNVEEMEEVSKEAAAETADIISNTTVTLNRAASSDRVNANSTTHSPEICIESQTSALNDTDDDDDGGDLDSNFAFLATSGLLRRSPAGGTARSGGASGLGEPSEAGMEAAQEPDTTNALDIARAQAKEAMERYDSASSVMTETTVQNGPV